MSKRPTGIQNTRLCRRNAARLPAFLLLCVPVHAATLVRSDPAFEKYPVDQWLHETHQPHLRWRVELPPTELTAHQRLMARVITHIDGRELDRRRGEGDFLVLMQYRDESGRLWQQHAGVDLAKIQPGVAGNEVVVTNFAFVLPGEYLVTVAVIDTRTGEHNAVQRKLHVPALKTDPLRDAWAGLPPVEFIAPTVAPPDVWYLPDIQSHLKLTLETRHAVHVQILVNTTPTERAAGSAYALRRNMSLLIPALKVLSQIEVRNGSVDAAFLDLTRRRIAFEQKDIHIPDWELARQFFLQLNPGIIDVHALEGQWKMRRFFWEQVTRRLAVQGPEIPVVIVLSGPAFLEDQEPVEAVTSANSHLFYVRYRALPVRARARPRPGMRPPPPPTAFSPMSVDDLEHTVEPLGARLFDAATAEQFRRVLAAILEQISQI
ncbi:MAG: hypothetical protein ABUS49_07680 [Acidobacteriota bacterium]